MKSPSPARDGFALVLAAIALCLVASFASTTSGCSSESGDGSDAQASETSNASDGATSDVDAGEAGTGSPWGDRNLGVSEPYPDVALIQNGGHFYDVKKPPNGSLKAAVGDGITDDTAALQDAYDYVKNAYVTDNCSVNVGACTSQITIYLPKGTYLVSNTIIYRGLSLEPDAGYAWNDVVHVRFVGENREQTTLRLADGAAGFGDAKNPKIVLAFQHPDTRFNNIPGANVLRNLTIDTGHGNPGAVGVFFQGANQTQMGNVLVRSGDGAGAYGVWFKIGSVQGHYHDITVDGFDYGVYQNVNAEVDSSLEHVTLTNQHVSAVGVSGGGMSLRALHVDERATGAGGLSLTPSGEQVVLVDSDIWGAKRNAITSSSTSMQSLFVRNVTTAGFDASLVVAGNTAVTTPAITEYVEQPPVTTADAGTVKSLALSIEDVPLQSWFDPATEWANADDFGAAGDGTTDDTAAIQKAMASGKPVVFFNKNAYKVTATIKVPATVKRIDAMHAFGGNLDIDEASTDPIVVTNKDGYGSVNVTAARDVVIDNCSGGFLNHSPSPIKVFVENASNIGGDPAFDPAGQTLWARGLNDENGSGPGDVIVAGGTLWMFDYKTENKPVVSVVASSGARVEVLGGYVNSTAAQGTTSMIVNDHSTMTYIGFTNLNGTQWTNAIQEITDAGTTIVPRTALPLRDTSGNFTIPLYVGHP